MPAVTYGGAVADRIRTQIKKNYNYLAQIHRYQLRTATGEKDGVAKIGTY